MRYAALLTAAGIALFAAGCAYHDDGYGYNGRHDRAWHDRDGDQYRDRDNYHDDNRGDRVRVCDADGDDCHWEYRRHEP